MRILAIETSCDETSIALIDIDSSKLTIHAHHTLSQIEKHREYGGVFPSLAKREHSTNLVPILDKIITDSEIATTSCDNVGSSANSVREILSREPELAEALLSLCSEKGRIEIEAIAVTHGPGLEPALWVGINFAKALSVLWNAPVIPVNHIEGHIASLALSSESDPNEYFLQGEYSLSALPFPATALVVSGGHTELIHLSAWGEYTKIGNTKDDAVGEAFDKVARLLGLPYPGGPEISHYAQSARDNHIQTSEPLKRPMIDSGDLSFSFSGIKTAVRYRVHSHGSLTDQFRKTIAREFEEAVVDVLIVKSRQACIEHGTSSLLITGGVSANPWLRKQANRLEPDISPHFAPIALTGDNALMIGLAGYYRNHYAPALVLTDPTPITAIGNLSLGEQIYTKEDRTM